MLFKKEIHSIIMICVLGLILPLGFDLKSSAAISFGFGSVFSLLRLNTRFINNYQSK